MVARYDFARDEMLGYVPEHATRILDVGCATGRFGALLSGVRPDRHVWGIDTDEGPVGAHRGLERRLVGRFPEDMPEGSMFDCIVFNDVLEHMTDPWAALRATQQMLTPGAAVVASIPNVRHRSVLQPLLLKGEWTYRERGILDRTHLRFFTKNSIRGLFDDCGFVVTTLDPINQTAGGRTGLINRLTRGRLVDFLAEQYAVVAVPTAGDAIA